jgi:hypothetical protein
MKQMISLNFPACVMVVVKFMNGKTMIMEVIWTYIQQVEVRKDR